MIKRTRLSLLPILQALPFDVPGRTLRLSGGLGTRQEMAAAGTLTWNCTPSGAGTSIGMARTVGGYNPKGFGPVVTIVDRVLSGRMDRLNNGIDPGNPESAGTPEG